MTTLSYIPKSVTTLLFSFIATIVWGQGLNCELGFNEDYSQWPTHIQVLDEFTYVAKHQMRSQTQGTPSSVIKIDSNGAVLWETPVASSTIDGVLRDLHVSKTGSTYALGVTQGCDVVGEAGYYFVEKLDANGNILWVFAEEFENTDFHEKVRFINTTADNTLSFVFRNKTTQRKVTIDTNGTGISSHSSNFPDFSKYFSTHDNRILGFTNDTLMLCDTLGNTIAQVQFATTVTDGIFQNDSLYIATLDSLLLLDSQLNVLQATQAPQITKQSVFFQDGNAVILACLDSSSAKVYTVSPQLNYTTSSSVSITGKIQDGIFSFNNNHLAIADRFALYRDYAIRFLDYSLNTSTQATVPTTDIGITALRATKTELTEWATNVYDLTVEAEVLLKNYGNTVLNSCRINHDMEQGAFCAVGYYTQEFTDLNLQPGDSMWVDLGYMHSSRSGFNPQDTVRKTLCVFTSYPNAVTDTLAANDVNCTTINAGTVGIEELLNPKEKTLLEIIDLTGKRVPRDNPGIVILRYSDGTVKKVFNTRGRAQ